jgi:chorismate dehydratase
VEKKVPFVYDLAEEWMRFTGLPFVFAVWASTTELTNEFTRMFNQALEKGIKMIPEKMEAIRQDYPGVDISDYFTQNISFHFDREKRAALELFLSYISQLLTCPF